LTIGVDKRTNGLIARILQKLNAQFIFKQARVKPCECQINEERGGVKYAKKKVCKGKCLRKP
jgi:hypothetical protein